MAAFANNYVTSITEFPLLYNGNTYVVVYRGNTGYHDNYGYHSRHLDALIKDFKSSCDKIVALDNFACRPRERIVGRDYKTPAGMRPYWFRPEVSSEDPPLGVSLPRWREYRRRRA